MKVLISIILCICLSLSVTASQTAIYQFEYDDLGITIIFEDDSNFTNDERKYLADILAYDTPVSDNATTYAWCWLTGHDYQYDSVISIEHKVDDLAPRCYQTIYKVETCSKCDHLETTIINTSYIDCCPEE